MLPGRDADHRPEVRQVNSEGDREAAPTTSLHQPSPPCPGVALMHTSREARLFCLQLELCTHPPGVVLCCSSPAITCTGDCQSGAQVRAAIVGVGTPENGRMEGLASPRGNTHQLLPQPPPVLQDHAKGSLQVICLDSQTENGARHLGRSFLNSFHLREWKLS